MIEFISKILASCASFSWIYEIGMVSVVFFGESPYPTPEEE